MNYPKEWNQLSRYERRKKIKELVKTENKKTRKYKKIKKILWPIIVVVGLMIGFKLATKKGPEQTERQQEIATVSLEGKVEEFPIEGRDHVPTETKVEYKTNPPTSGGHLAEAENWGVYSKEIDDKAAVHGLEHGGIWISYKEIDDESRKILEQVGKRNPLSVIVSPRMANDDKIAVVAWGRMMKLEAVDQTLIQKFIDSYKNQAPENLAR